MQQPNLGLTTNVELVKVLDGDTIRVKISREVDVRITDDKGTYNTKEIHKPASDEEIAGGLEAKSYLEKTLRNNPDEIVLHVPASEDGEIKDIFTLGRVVGHVFVKGQDITDVMTLAGHNITLKKKKK